MVWLTPLTSSHLGSSTHTQGLCQGTAGPGGGHRAGPCWQGGGGGAPPGPGLGEGLGSAPLPPAPPGPAVTSRLVSIGSARGSGGRVRALQPGRAAAMRRPR